MRYHTLSSYLFNSVLAVGHCYLHLWNFASFLLMKIYPKWSPRGITGPRVYVACELCCWMCLVLSPSCDVTLYMDTGGCAFSKALLALCQGSPPTGGFPSQRAIVRGFGAFFDVRLHTPLNKQSTGRWSETLWQPCDVDVMANAHRESAQLFWNLSLVNYIEMIQQIRNKFHSEHIAIENVCVWKFYTTDIFTEGVNWR